VRGGNNQKVKTVNQKKREKADLTAMLKFTETGYLKTIYLCASTDQAQKKLEAAIERLIKSYHWGWLRRLIRRDQ
jgi:hypothetical protein